VPHNPASKPTKIDGPFPLSRTAKTKFFDQSAADPSGELPTMRSSEDQIATSPHGNLDD
jgi:hypothetical protein